MMYILSYYLKFLNEKIYILTGSSPFHFNLFSSYEQIHEQLGGGVLATKQEHGYKHTTVRMEPKGCSES